MSATTVTAICGVVIAVASLGVSAYVAWATRQHNRLLVRPLLELTITFPTGTTGPTTAGLRLTNFGLVLQSGFVIYRNLASISWETAGSPGSATRRARSSSRIATRIGPAMAATVMGMASHGGRPGLPLHLVTVPEPPLHA